MFQTDTNWADGAAFVNQCPISANNSFTYTFTAADQAGTFWYHSHYSTQYCDGLRGPLVIYDPDDPYLDLYDVDDGQFLSRLAACNMYLTYPSFQRARLSRLWTGTTPPRPSELPSRACYMPLVERFKLTYSSSTADSTLINGLGRSTDSSGADATLAVVNVTQGKRYRFRLLSLSCDPNHTFSIDGHNMTVIEVDGVNHEELTVDEIQILAGQRYSFVLTADQDIDNYWIRAIPSAGTTSTDGGINSAILRYDGAAEVEPTTNATSDAIALNETNLVPLENLTPPGTAEVGGVDLAINFEMTFVRLPSLPPADAER